MTKYYEIKDLRNANTTIIGTGGPLEIGSIIKLGDIIKLDKDEQEDDGWKVIREIWMME